MTPEWRAAMTKRRARALGFDSVGITDLQPPAHADALRRWLAAGMAGSMRYMHRQAPRRFEPQHILRGATHAVVVTRKYYHNDPPGKRVGAGRVAMYAWGEDYHRALQPPLCALAEWSRVDR
jgi:epoxyqueuosine reductase